MMTPFIPFPTRISPASGAYTLATTTSVDFGGVNAKQSRVLFILTNTHATNAIQLRTGSNNRVVATIAASTSFALATTAAIQVYNPNGTDATCNVLELYPDIEGSLGEFGKQVASAGGSGGSFGSGPGAFGGGATGGESGFGGSVPGGGGGIPR
jgi:hypothetical protein